MKVPKGHFYVYLITFIVSLGLIFCVFIGNEHLSSIFVSLGTGGVTSCMVGYFVDLANSLHNKNIRDRNLSNIISNHKIALERMLYCFFRVMLEVYKENDSGELYKSSIKDIKNNLNKKFEKYDNECFITQNGSSIVLHDLYTKHQIAIQIMKMADNKLLYLSKAIDAIIKQDKYGLLNYYDENEIDYLTNITNYILPESEGQLSDYFSIFETLIDNNFCKILNINDIENYNFYYKDKKCVIHTSKGKIFSAFERFKDFKSSEAKDIFKENL